MTQPFSRMPEPEIPRPFKRRFQPDGVQRAVQDTWRQARRHAEDLWRKGKRHPRVLGMAGVAVALTLVGAYTLSASGADSSLCAGGSKGAKGPEFLLLMDPVTRPIAGPELEIHYDVCGLSSGTAYYGKLQITRQQPAGKKKSAKLKPVVIKFQDRVDGVATRRHRDVPLGKLKPGAYTLELAVSDAKGRERKRLQKIRVSPR